jgi:N-acetylglucosamine kinase-like BadF-type ATPase
MRNDYFAGIDAGGTKTELAVVDKTGHLVGYGKGGPANHLSVGLERMKKSLVEALEDSGCGNLNFKSAYIGYSGLGIWSPSELLEKMGREVLNTDRLTINNDCYNALYGGFGGEPGIVAVTGTGSMVLSLDASGNVNRLGGWGHILGDWGSGYRIAIQAIQIALKAKDGTADTILYQKMIDFFGFDSTKALVRYFYIDQHSKSEVAAFAPVVIEAAATGDEEARMIVEENALEIARTALSMRRRIEVPDRLAIVGGLSKSRLFMKFLEQGISGKLKLCRPLLQPVFGAVLIAIKRHGEVDSATIEKLVEESEEYAHEGRL